MTAAAVLSIPRVEQIPLGADAMSQSGGVPAQQRFLHADHSAPVFGLVQNDGDTDLTLVIDHSQDDGVGDAYAALSMRINGAAVTSVTVKPRSRVAFAIEAFATPNAVEKWVRVRATARDVNGRVTLAHWTGEFTRIGAHL